MWQAEEDITDQEQAVAQTAPEEAGADTDQQTSSSPEDTGETPEIQAEPPLSEPAKELTWEDHLTRYYNDMNGLLAGKENLKIVAINTSARQSFYRKWSNEANNVLRITANLRRRLKTAKQKAS